MRNDVIICLFVIVGRLESVPTGDGTSRCGQHVWPVTQLGAGSATTDNYFTNGVVWSNLIVVKNSNHHLDFLNLFEGYFKAEIDLIKVVFNGQVSRWVTVPEGLVVVWGKCILFDCSFLLFEPFPIHHEIYLHIGIWEATGVHFLEIFCLQNHNIELATGRYISKWETDIAEFFTVLKFSSVGKWQ